MQPLTARFQSYLQAPRLRGRLAPSTVKNYLSDTNHFLTWLSQSLQETIIKPEHVTPATCAAYCHHLQTASKSATAARRLSSLRQFGAFLAKTGLLEHNPAQNLSPIAPKPVFRSVLHQFKRHLIKQKLAPSTVKNYLSDVKNYLLWTQKNSKTTDMDLELRS